MNRYVDNQILKMDAGLTMILFIKLLKKLIGKWIYKFIIDTVGLFDVLNLIVLVNQFDLMEP